MRFRPRGAHHLGRTPGLGNADRAGTHRGHHGSASTIMSVSLQSARQQLHDRGFTDRIMTFETSTATVELAAQAVGTQPERIAKTLSFNINGTPTLIVFAGDARIDNKAFKARFSTKARMIPSAEVEAAVGHAPGGVTPFGVAPGVAIYLDESLRRFDFVYPAAGTATSAVRLTPAELETASGASGWIAVSTF